ncbi:DUF5671 domain-containing protein [Arenimonas metalli]|uniref:DUF5671 domain-containing protein n=1 Tax=Arenimonas metalli CF5-1 TaxID=1384056 RepID=A0A091BVR0_9GAMM|nr:DUF5671 domain-containing protein [Arenimonas metalli]KFN48410.1 hypothetical protein N787_00330 [Arenimonas metalli CF5-1]
MANASQDLDVFVRDALVRGLPRGEIEQALVTAGWPQEQARAALSVYADQAFPVPVPRPRAYLSAREAFLYLTLFVTLYLFAYHLGSLLFDLLNLRLPDPADNEYRAAQLPDSIRFSTAALIISFPVFLFLANLVAREQRSHPAKRLSVVRRWLTYLTLFVAACVLLGDMIALVDGLLSGEASLRFLLKVAVVLAIAGSVLGYYLWDLRRDEADA